MDYKFWCKDTTSPCPAKFYFDEFVKKDEKIFLLDFASCRFGKYMGDALSYLDTHFQLNPNFGTIHPQNL